MNGARAKTIRRMVLGEGYSIKARQYMKMIHPNGVRFTIEADDKRQAYKAAKRLWKEAHVG